MPIRVVILGAGFGGLELATRLADEVPDEVDVTLIDKNDAFVFGYAKLDVMFGRKTYDEVRLHYADIAKPSVRFRQETITSIDPVAKRVVTNKETYDADILFVALGADLAPAATPGLLDGSGDEYEFYSPDGAARLRDILPTFEGGNVVIGVLGGFFKCPPAPYEAALMMHDLAERKGIVDTTNIYVVSPLPKPIPISDEVSQEILSMLASKGIENWGSSRITHLDPHTKVVHLDDGRELPYDLFLGIPVHKAPDVVVESGLTDDGWIAVDPATFATKFPDVYAVGDVTSAPVPRSGVFAEGEAGTVADALIAGLTGGEMPGPYAGNATCFMEMGDETVWRVDVNFLGGPAPTADFSPPSEEGAREKGEFGLTRRRRWFGHQV
jgi:sulfide:quinone oxidoreductase